ncbi:MAG: VOC family protein [Pseudomonadota bacterium]
MARVLGVGGVFFLCEDARAVGEWYQRWLGMPVEPPYGASLQPANMPPGGMTVWAPFRHDTDYFSPSAQPFMVNLVVDDLDAALAQVREGGAEVIDEIQDEPYGRFGWFIDPVGVKVELWEPREVEADAGD